MYGKFCADINVRKYQVSKKVILLCFKNCNSIKGLVEFLKLVCCERFSLFKKYPNAASILIVPGLQGKYQVPLPQVKAVSDAEAFKVVNTGKTRRKGWKRMCTKVTFVGENFTRKPAKFERFIRPMGLRFKKVSLTFQFYLGTLAKIFGI